MAMDNDDWPDSEMELRRAAVKKTIRPITREELKQLGTARFPIATDPWAIRYFEFLEAHPHDHYFHAELPDNAEIVYDREAERGMWFIAGNGMGVIQAKGLLALRGIVDGLSGS
jgi:hypothetical protein